MPIPDSILGAWNHHHSGAASKQAHVSIRNALASYNGWTKETRYDVFLQGSYKNDTNLRRDSDVDVVVELAARLKPRVAALSGNQLEQDQFHKLAFQRWHSFRDQVMKALRIAYGNKAVTSGRKSIKLAKGQIPASADVVVTLHSENGITFYLASEHRWVVSYPQQHHSKGLKKERSTNNRYKRTIRMFKAARNHLLKNNKIKDGMAPSYFIECLLYNVPDNLFKESISQSYIDIIGYLTNKDLRQFKCQNGVRELFGQSKDLWNIDKAQNFIKELRLLWKTWPKSA
ncbi:nucleotidyltransferase [Chloroflexota bacterium]